MAKRKKQLAKVQKRKGAKARPKARKLSKATRGKAAAKRAVARAKTKRALSDVTRHVDGGGVRPHQKLASRKGTCIVAQRHGYRRLVSMGETGQQQQTEQEHGAHDVFSNY
jgi:hypothetical protein